MVDIGLIAALYNSGLTLEAVAARMGVSKQVIYYHMKKFGVPRRTSAEGHQLPLNHEAFDSYGEQAEYWAGFLLADAHIAKPRGNGQPQLELCLSEKDACQLEAFAEFASAAHPIKRKRSTHGVQLKLSFRSARMCSRLLELWSGNRAKLDRIPSPHLAGSRHFWRGVVDGDGSMFTGGDGSFRFSVCGSYSLMQAFATFCEERVPMRRPKLRANKSIFEVRAGGRTGKAIAETLYSNCTVALPRKKKLALANLRGLKSLYKNSPLAA